VLVRIGAVAPLFSVLELPARVGRRARAVAARIACTVPATLTVAGRRFPCDLRARRVALPVRAGAGPVAITLTLTSAGKRTRVVRTVARP